MENKVNLFELCQQMINRIKDLPETKKFIADYTHAYQFEGEGIEPFYLQIDHGTLTLHKGTIQNPLDAKSTLHTDYNTLRELLVGKLKPLDAADQGRWNMRARNYSGNLLILLFRINQDKVIEELLAKL